MTRFRVEFSLTVEVQQLAKEFLDMRHTAETVVDIISKFRERALLIPQYTADEEMRKTQYHDLLRFDIREFVIFSAFPILDDMIARARE